MPYIQSRMSNSQIPPSSLQCFRMTRSEDDVWEGASSSVDKYSIHRMQQAADLIAF